MNEIKKWETWLSKPGSKVEFLTVIILAATLIITTIFNYLTFSITNQQLAHIRKAEELTFYFSLKKEFPRYIGPVHSDTNGQWIGIPYIFTNPNDYETYYRVDWLLLAESENSNGRLAQTATNSVFNHKNKRITKKTSDEAL